MTPGDFHEFHCGLIPRNQESNPRRFVRCKTTSTYEAMILSPKQAFAVLMNLDEPERTLTLPASATGLRISECLGLQWQDVDFERSEIPMWGCRRLFTTLDSVWPSSGGERPKWLRI